MKLKGTSALLAAGVLIASVAAAEEIDRDFHKSFEVKTGDRLHLDHGDGDVVIEPWDQDTLDVEVRYRAEFSKMGIGSNKVEFDVEFRRSGDTVHVIGKERGWSGGVGFFRFETHEHIYLVRGPAYLLLDLEGEDGDVSIERWRGEIEIRNEDGDIDLEGIEAASVDLDLEDGDVDIDGLAGALSIQAEDGTVRISDCSLGSSRVRLEDGDAIFRRCEGSAQIDSDDGDVILERFRADGVVIRTEDGDVELDLLESAALDLEVRTDDGDVVVDVEPGLSASFTIDTNDGPIRLDVPSGVDISNRRRSASGTLGAGAGRIKIVTGDGTVVLREGG